MTRSVDTLIDSLGAGGVTQAGDTRAATGGGRFEALLDGVDLGGSEPGSLRMRIGALAQVPIGHDHARAALDSQIGRAQRSGRPEDIAKLAVRLSHYTTETQVIVKAVQKATQAFSELSRMQ
jgi:hypothetical protein